MDSPVHTLQILAMVGLGQPLYLELLGRLETFAALQRAPHLAELLTLAAQNPQMDAIVLPYHPHDAPFGVEEIRRDPQLAHMPVFVIHSSDIVQNLSASLGAIAVIGSGTQSLSFTEHLPTQPDSAAIRGAVTAVAERIKRCMLAPIRPVVNVTEAQRFLVGIPDLRGIESDHTQRDLFGPLYTLCACSGTYAGVLACWRELTAEVRRQRQQCADAPGRHRWEAADWRMQRLPTLADGPVEASGGQALLVDDNSAAWTLALRPLCAVEPLTLPGGDLDSFVARLSREILDRTLLHPSTANVPCRSLIIGVRLHPRDIDESYVNNAQTARQFSGLRVIENLRNNKQLALPIVVLTGSKNAFVEQAIQNLDGIYMVKPSNLDEAKENVGILQSLFSPDAPKNKSYDVRRDLCRIIHNKTKIRIFGQEYPDDDYLLMLEAAISLWNQSLNAEEKLNISHADRLRSLAMFIFGGIAERICDWLLRRQIIYKPRGGPLRLRGQYIGNQKLTTLFEDLYARRVHEETLPPGSIYEFRNLIVHEGRLPDAGELQHYTQSLLLPHLSAQIP